MSAALVIHPDVSNGTQDISLGSLGSFSTTPARPGLRVPSASSRTTAQSSAPISTPSPPTTSAIPRRKVDDHPTSLSSRLSILNHDDEADDGIGDVLDSPALGKKKWGNASETPGAVTRSKRPKTATSTGKGTTLTLRDQEKVRFSLVQCFFANVTSNST
jgi:hypothetical protein